MRLLQTLITLAVLVLVFQGKGSHGVLIALFLIVPFLRFLFSPSYREACNSFLKTQWAALEAFSRKEGQLPLPLGASFFYAGIPILFFGLVNGVSLSSMDNYPTMATAASLLLDRDVDLSEMTEYPGQKARVCDAGGIKYYWLRCTSEGAYSAYPAGMVFFALPVAVVSLLVRGDLRNATVQWRLQKWTGAWIAAISVTLFLLISLHFVSLPAAFLTTLFLSLGSALLSTVSQGLWTQGGVVFGFLMAILIELRFSGRSALVGQSFCFALMLACRLSSAALILPFGIWIAARAPWRALLTATTAALWHLPLTFYYWKIYGNFLGPQMQMGEGMGVSINPLSALQGLLFSPGRGLFVYQPWCLLLLLFLIPSYRRIREPVRGFLWMCAIASSLHLLIICYWPCWYGGTCWGSRLLTETIPPLAFFVLFPVEKLWKEKPAARALLPALVVLSFLMHVPALYFFGIQWAGNPKSGITVPDEVRLWDWSDPPFLYPFR